MASMKSLNLRRMAVVTAAGLAFCVASSAVAQDAQVLTPDEIVAMADDSSSISGAKHFKMLSHDGDEVVAIKIWLPANADIPPHGNIKEGRAAAVLVLSGDLELAMGDEFDESKLQPMPVGSLIVLTPENDTHFARTGDAPVELLVVQSFSGDFADELEIR